MWPTTLLFVALGPDLTAIVHSHVPLLLFNGSRGSATSVTSPLVLQDSLTPRGVAQWHRARNRMLGGRRPIELTHEGDLARVKDAAQAFVDGVYV
jgi:hypothetical protein